MMGYMKLGRGAPGVEKIGSMGFSNGEIMSRQQRAGEVRFSPNSFQYTAFE